MGEKFNKEHFQFIIYIFLSYSFCNFETFDIKKTPKAFIGLDSNPRTKS